MKNKLNFFLSALLVLLFLTLSGNCFADTKYSLTFEQFKEIIEDDGFKLDSNVTASNISGVLNNSPLILKNCYCKDYSGYDNYLLIYSYDIENGWRYSVKVDNDDSTIYMINDANDTYRGPTMKAFGYNSDNILYYLGYTSYGNAGFSLYSYYKDEYTVNEYRSQNFQKKILMDKVVYHQSRITFGYGTTNLMYKFDGVFKGNGTQEPYTSSFTANNTALRFEYTAYTDLTDSNVVNYFFLQEFTPSQAVNLTDEDLNFTDSDEQIVINQKLRSTFSYTSLIRRMQQGYIYRLYCFSNQHNESGDLLRTTDSTSCFFSLNSWKSNAITVLNIYNIMFPENSDIEQEGGTSGGVIDLENIENSINNANKDYWGDPDNINPEDFENELENNFNGIMENLSGELTQNQIFESLQGAEDGFLNFFKEEQNEQFYDLAFSWPDVEFMGETLIPAGGINISEMCREIPELETLRSYIRVIFNFSVAVALIKQIYNLILSTLGIDNPYLYENYDEVTAINTDTGEYKEMAYKRKRIYNRRR